MNGVTDDELHLAQVPVCEKRVTIVRRDRAIVRVKKPRYGAKREGMNAIRHRGRDKVTQNYVVPLCSGPVILLESHRKQRDRQLYKTDGILAEEADK